MNAKETALSALMLDDYADELSNHVCNDWEFPEDWIEQEAREFATRVWSWSMSEEDSRDAVNRMGEFGFPVLMDSIVVRYLAYELMRAAL